MACSAAWQARESDVATRIAAYETDATVSFAGPQAQRKYRDTNIKRASRTDWRNDWQFASSAAAHIVLLKDGIEPSEDTLNGMAPLRRNEINKCCNKLWAAAGELVDINWPAIERVAAELLRQPLLDQDTLDALIAS